MGADFSGDENCICCGCRGGGEGLRLMHPGKFICCKEGF